MGPKAFRLTSTEDICVLVRGDNRAGKSWSPMRGAPRRSGAGRGLGTSGSLSAARRRLRLDALARRLAQAAVQKGKFPVIGFVKDPSEVAALYLGKKEGNDLVYMGKGGRVSRAPFRAKSGSNSTQSSVLNPNSPSRSGNPRPPGLSQPSWRTSNTATSPPKGFCGRVRLRDCPGNGRGQRTTPYCSAPPSRSGPSVVRGISTRCRAKQRVRRSTAPALGGLAPDRELKFLWLVPHPGRQVRRLHHAGGD